MHRRREIDYLIFLNKNFHKIRFSSNFSIGVPKDKEHFKPSKWSNDESYMSGYIGIRIPLQNFLCKPSSTVKTFKIEFACWYSWPTSWLSSLMGNIDSILYFCKLSSVHPSCTKVMSLFGTHSSISRSLEIIFSVGRGKLLFAPETHSLLVSGWSSFW